MIVRPWQDPRRVVLIFVLLLSMSCTKPQSQSPETTSEPTWTFEEVRWRSTSPQGTMEVRAETLSQKDSEALGFGIQFTRHLKDGSLTGEAETLRANTSTQDLYFTSIVLALPSGGTVHADEGTFLADKNTLTLQGEVQMHLKRPALRIQTESLMLSLPASNDDLDLQSGEVIGRLQPSD